jgi:hypothetical protein
VYLQRFADANGARADYIFAVEQVNAFVQECAFGRTCGRRRNTRRKTPNTREITTTSILRRGKSQPIAEIIIEKEHT